MPLYLSPPRPGRSQFWRVRGKYLGVSVDRSTETDDRAKAERLLRRWQEDIERGVYAGRDAPTFAGAAASYMNSGRDRRFIAPLLKHFGLATLASIDQAAVDRAAVTIYPEASPATRARQVYVPVAAILHHAGVQITLRKPKGAKGVNRTFWFTPDQFFKLLDGAQRVDARIAAYIAFLTYCGPRLSEALRLEWADVDIERRYAYLRTTKNGEPQPVHLTAFVAQMLAALPRTYHNPVLRRDFEYKTVFGMTKKMAYEALAEAEKLSGVTIPPGVAFHAFRHTYGAWQRRYGGLDTSALVQTGRWKDRSSAARYEHAEASEAAQAADLLPTPPLRLALAR